MSPRELDFTCSIEGCDLPGYARETRLCSRHYGRLRRNGDPLGGLASSLATPAERFWTKVDRKGDTDCWLWLGYAYWDGYGEFTANYKKVRAHRYAYEQLVGPIPDGLVLDHLCRNTRCVNPQHLEPVTNCENVLRGVGASALNAAKTHCIRGHAYTPENTISGTRNGRPTRRCRTCYKAWRAARGEVRP